MSIIEFKRNKPKPTATVSDEKVVKKYPQVYNVEVFVELLNRYKSDLKRLLSVEHHLNVELPLMQKASQEIVGIAVTHTVNSILSTEITEMEDHLIYLAYPEYSEARTSVYATLVGFYEWRANLNARYYSMTFNINPIETIQIILGIDAEGLFVKNIFTEKHSLYSLVAQAISEGGFPNILLGA